MRKKKIIKNKKYTFQWLLAISVAAYNRSRHYYCGLSSFASFAKKSLGNIVEHL